MSELIQMQIDNARSEILVWNNFSEAVSKLNDEDIKKEGGERFQMVWTSNGVDYFLDHSTEPSIDKFVSKKNGVLTNVRFYVPNYDLRKGKDSCLKQIATAIENLEKSIEALKQNL